MFRFTCSFAIATMLALSSVHVGAADETTSTVVSNTEIVQFIIDRNRFHADRDLDAILKYFPDGGVITVNLTDGDNPREVIQTRDEVAAQTRKVWETYDPSELSSGLALRSVIRKPDRVVLECSYVELVPCESRHIYARGVLRFTLVKATGKTKMAKKELLSVTSKWIDMEKEAAP